MELDTALQWAGNRHNGVLITIRADGRPQSSDISFSVDDGSFLISVTEDRAKARNLRRDPRAVLHITDPANWSYLSFDGTAELSPTAAASDDETVDRLAAQYEAVTGGPHPDWDDFRRTMVADHRLMVRFIPASVVGMVNT